MDRLNDIDQQLLSEAVRQYGLPLHLIFSDRVKENAVSFGEIADRFYPETQICFAVKANPCRGAVRLMSSLDLGVDTVSEFELQAALEEGIGSARIVCNGNAKSDTYLALAVASETLIVVDAAWEIAVLKEMARSAGKRVNVLLRVAGMPLDGLTSADQSTASVWTKFGTSPQGIPDLVRQLNSCERLKFAGLSAHIGTQICDALGYDRLIDHLMSVAVGIISAGNRIGYIDIGGGFPVSYMTEPDWERFCTRLAQQQRGGKPPAEWVTWDNIPMGFAETVEEWRGKAYWSEHPGAIMLERLLTRVGDDGKSVAESLQRLGTPALIIEPGRSLIGTAGMTVAAVSGVKQIQGNNVVTVELGIVNHGTNLVTPDIFPVEVWPKRDTDKPVDAFLAGRLCFTGDMISKVKVSLNRLPDRGDLLIIHHTGAYSADHFASHSCGFPLPAKIALSEDGSMEVWREPESFSDVFPSTQ